MSTSNEELTAGLYGMLSAIQTTLRAIVKSHPDPEKLAIELNYEYERNLALLVAESIPDSSIEAYREYFEDVTSSLDA